jgi:hypothetical protein
VKGEQGPKGATGAVGATGARGATGAPAPKVSLTRRAAFFAAFSLATAGGIGALIIAAAFGPTVFSKIEDNRTAIQISCHQLNKKIKESQTTAATNGTNLLIAEIVEGMTRHERRQYMNAVANAPPPLETDDCKRIAERAYDD